MVEESISCLYVDDDKLTKGEIIIQEGVDYWNEVFEWAGGVRNGLKWRS